MYKRAIIVNNSEHCNSNQQTEKFQRANIGTDRLLVYTEYTPETKRNNLVAMRNRGTTFCSASLSAYISVQLMAG
jgi:hypothetical protein